MITLAVLAVKLFSEPTPPNRGVCFVHNRPLLFRPRRSVKHGSAGFFSEGRVKAGTDPGSSTYLSRFCLLKPPLSQVKAVSESHWEESGGEFTRIWAAGPGR